MFKRNKQKNQSKSGLLKNRFSDEKDFFKSGSIEMSVEEVFKSKLYSLKEITSLPKNGQQFRIVTQKSINSFDFILAILANEKINELIISFYRIGKKVITEIHDLQKKDYIKKVHFLLNDGAPKLIPEAYNRLKEFESKKWIVRLANNHTKIILCKTNENWYVVEGSGNLSINARIEQYVFDNDKQLFNFHKKWITVL